MNMIKGIPGAMAATAIAASLSLGPVYADTPGRDWKGYAGVNCLPASPNHDIRRSAIGQIGFANHGTGTITVFCPVVRDVAEGGENRVAAVAVRMRNRSSVDGRCEFSSRDINGMTHDTKSVVFPPGEFVKTMGPINASNWGSYVLSCQLPGLHPTTKLPSYIVNYRVDEDLP
jgi:hypothetical protein